MLVYPLKHGIQDLKSIGKHSWGEQHSESERQHRNIIKAKFQLTKQDDQHLKPKSEDSKNAQQHLQ